MQSRLAQSRRGSGPTLVVLRQLDRPLWKPVVDRLTTEREVVQVDLPGFGESPALPSGETSPADLAAAVAAWFGSAGLGRPHVVGNSMGGAVALELAGTGAARSATAISPLGFWSDAGIRFALASVGMARRVARRLGPRADRVAGSSVGRALAFGQLARRPTRISEDAAADMLRGMASSPAFEAIHRALRAYRLEGFEHPGIPITIAWGRFDLLTPVSQARRAERLLPQARHVRLHGVGHSPMFDDPDLIARLIVEASRDRPPS